MPRKTPLHTAERPTAQRLRDALAEMVGQQAAGGPSHALTAKALCESAGISRNALYRYHRDVLLALHDGQRRQRDRPDASRRVAVQLRRENRELRQGLAKLAALVDHYFAAWQEVRLQLERRDRELADLRRTPRPQVVPLRR